MISHIIDIGVVSLQYGFNYAPSDYYNRNTIDDIADNVTFSRWPIVKTADVEIDVEC